MAWPPGNGCVLIRCDGGARSCCCEDEGAAAARLPPGMAYHVAFFEAGAPLSASPAGAGALISAAPLLRECGGVRQRVARCADCVLIASSQFGALRVPAAVVGGAGSLPGPACDGGAGRGDAVAEAFCARNLKRFLTLAEQPSAFSACVVPRAAAAGCAPPAASPRPRGTPPGAADAAAAAARGASASIDALRRRVVAFHVAAAASPRGAPAAAASPAAAAPEAAAGAARAAYAAELAAGVARVLAAAGMSPSAAPPALRALLEGATGGDNGGLHSRVGGGVGSAPAGVGGALAADVALLAELRQVVSRASGARSRGPEPPRDESGGGLPTAGAAAVPPQSPRHGTPRVYKRMSVVHAPCMLLLSEVRA